MTRRQFICRAGIGGIAAAGSWAHSGRAHASGRRRPPNLLLFLTDDQRWDALGLLNPILRTPNMDALAAKGVRFGNAFVTTSICAASRASILTGVVERTHMYTFGRPPLADRFVDDSYPALLRAAGYRTGFVGKFGVAVHRRAHERMFDVFVPLGRNPYFKKQRDGSERHLTDITGDRAIDFLRGCRRDEPFCLSISFNAPHAEDNDPRQYVWPKAFDGLYDDVTIPAPPTATEEFFESQPRFLRESLNRVRWKWRFDTPEKFQRMVKGYYRMITAVDAVIGRVMEELQRLRLADDTVVILTSDNGYFLGDRGFAGKWLPYEPSLRVPLIVFDPRGHREMRGRQRGQLVLNIDIAPTMLDLAGLPIPEAMQGKSLRRILAGERVRLRRRFFFEHLMEHPKIIKHEGVRNRRYKYVRYFQQEPVYEELYDLKSDPNEARNLVGEPGHARRLDRLRKQCDTLRDRYGGRYVGG